MKGTRLWQASGSPVIQGWSRNRRPFQNVWALAFAAATAALMGFITLVSAFPGDAGLPLSISFDVALSLALPAFPGLAAGSAAGVGLARAIGSRRAWIAGAVGGVVLGVVSLLLLVSALDIRGVVIK